MTRLLATLMALTLTCGSLSAQSCSETNLDDAQTAAVLAAGNDETVKANGMFFPFLNEKFVLRMTSHVGARAIPVLRKIAAPGNHMDTVPGAAQVALAKLGEGSEFEEIVRELNAEFYNQNATEKLVFIRNEKAASAMMAYLISKAHDRSRIRTANDYVFDPLVYIANGLTEMFEKVPKSKSSTGCLEQENAEEWIRWWNDNQRKAPLPPPASEALSDPFLRCLAREVEWGFSDSIFVLAQAGKQNAVPALKRLTLVGKHQRPYSDFGTTSGKAQAALAKLGDQTEFEAIVNDLSSSRPASASAVEKLMYIGGYEAVNALVDHLEIVPSDVEKFKSQPKYRSYYEQELLFYRRMLLSALGALVKNPPLPPSAEPTEDNLKTWIAWWATNKDKAEFITFQPQNVRDYLPY